MRRWANPTKGPVQMGLLERLEDLMPREESTYTLTPWESDELQQKQKQSDIAVYPQVSSTLQYPHPLASCKYDFRYLKRRRTKQSSIKLSELHNKLHEIRIDHEESPRGVSNDEVFARHFRSISIGDQMKDKSVRKSKLKLPNLPKMQALPTKLTLKGKKFQHTTIEYPKSSSISGMYSPEPYEKQKFETRDITPINLLEELKRRKNTTNSNGWLTSRKDLVISQLYSQIRSTIRLI